MYRHHSSGNVAAHVENTANEFLLKHNLRVAADVWVDGSARHQPVRYRHTDTGVHLHSHRQTHRQASAVFLIKFPLSCDFDTITKTSYSTPHGMEDTIWNKTRTSQNKYHKHVSNPTQFSPAQPRPVLTLWLLWPNYWNLLLLLTTSLSLLTWVRFNFPFVICIINVLGSYILNNSPYYHPQSNSPCFNVPSFLSSHIDRLIGWQANSCHPYSSGS